MWLSGGPVARKAEVQSGQNGCSIQRNLARPDPSRAGTAVALHLDMVIDALRGSYAQVIGAVILGSVLALLASRAIGWVASACPDQSDLVVTQQISGDG